MPLAGTAGPATPPAPGAVPAYRQAGTVAVLTVRGTIDGVTAVSLERRVKEALAAGAGAVVLELHTPGGSLDATREICGLIRSEFPANTVAWINREAYSAGTIIALACREIVVAPDAAFGDAAPVSPWGTLAPTERAKIEGPLLAEVVDSARRNRYDEKLVQSFVSMGVELWMIENNETRERIFVDRAEYRMVFGEEPPAQLTPVAPPAGAASPVRPWSSLVAPPADGPPPDPEAIRRQVEAEQDRPSNRPQLTAADRGRWTLLRQVDAADRLLVVKSPEALYYGLGAAVIADDEELRAWFGAQTVRRYDRSWSESLVGFLVHPIVMGVLLVVFVVCLLIELAMPGFGVFGATAVVALLLLMGAPLLAGMAQWWEILLIVVGLGLIGAELFIIPGFGAAGIAGLACLMVGVVGAFVAHDLGSAQGQAELMRGLGALLSAFAAAGVAGWFLFRRVESLPLLNRVILRAEVREPRTEPGLLEAMGSSVPPLAAGAAGTAATDLRPAGRAEFAGRLLDVRSIGGYIERGKRLRIVSVGKFVIEVEEAEP
jgi:membrane-bound ClpP family serine protease